MKVIYSSQNYFFQLGILSLVTLVSPNPQPIPAAGPDPDVPFSPIQDPEDPDFNGVVDFSKAKPGPDGSWCITKVIHCDEFLSTLMSFAIYHSIIVSINGMVQGKMCKEMQLHMKQVRVANFVSK